MLYTANIATYPSRESTLLKTLLSIAGQFDVIRLHINSRSKFRLTDEQLLLAMVTRSNVQESKVITTANTDLADNGKFIHLHEAQDEYYFTLDDDIFYPLTYRIDTVAAINFYNSIVSYHGRKLTSPVKGFYKQKPVYEFSKQILEPKRVDVGGTGVMAWNTNYFKARLFDSPHKKMSDVIHAHAAAKQGKAILVIAHTNNYFGRLPVPTDKTIWGTASRSATPIHDYLCEEIIKFRNENKDFDFPLR